MVSAERRRSAGLSAAGTGGPAVGSGRRGAGRSGAQGGLEASSWSYWRSSEDLE